MRARRRLVVAALVAGGALLATPAMIESVLRQTLYPAPPVAVPSPPPAPLVEVALAPVGGGRVVAWARPAPAAVPGRPVALFFHGNGENLETMRQAGLFARLAALDVPFLAVDYPGYGRSAGAPDEASLLAAAEAALDWARREHPGRPVVACGWSLGAAVAVGLVGRRRGELGGLALLSPWTTVADVAAIHFPAPLVRPLLLGRWDSVRGAAGISVPVLVIHGDADAIIPAEQGRRLAAAFPGEVRLRVVPGAGHNDLLAGEEPWEELARFLDRAAAPP